MVQAGHASLPSQRAHGVAMARLCYLRVKKGMRVEYHMQLVGNGFVGFVWRELPGDQLLSLQGQLGREGRTQRVMMDLGLYKGPL